MSGRLHRWVRDLHLYTGLFISPFVLVFSVSVFFLVHAWLPQAATKTLIMRVAADLPLPEDLARLSGRALIDALRPTLGRAGVRGEVGFVQHLVKEQRLIIPVTVPGRLTTVTLELATRRASIETRETGLADALVVLHKSPGPHLAALRMNWIYFRAWLGLADSTVYLVFFLSVTGVYLWYGLRAERRIGVALLLAGGVSFFAIAYGLTR